MESSNFAKETGSHDLLLKLKDHIVQIEAMLVYVVLSLVLLYVADSIDDLGKWHIPIWLFPSAILVGLRPIIRVNNPTAPVRKALIWATTLGGWGGAIVGATTDIMAGGLTAGQGTLLGIAGGSAVGAAVGNWVEGWGEKDRLLDRGEAFDYLYKKRHKCPAVANGQLINDALGSKISSFDKNQDGRHWYSKEDLDAYVQEKN